MIRTQARLDRSLITILSKFFLAPHSSTENAYNRPNGCRVVRTAGFNIAANSWTIDNL